METFRKLRVFADISTDAKYTIKINGRPTEQDLDCLFEFGTKTSFHGSVPISIEVQEGSLTLVKCHATYPATFNGIGGTITMLQPMEEPIGIFNNGMLESIPIKNIKINAGETFNYEHLLYNGPSLTVVKIVGHDIFEGVDVYVGDILHNDVIDGIEDFKFEFEYPDVKPHNIWKHEHFEKLKKFIIENN